MNQTEKMVARCDSRVRSDKDQQGGKGGEKPLTGPLELRQEGGMGVQGRKTSPRTKEMIDQRDWVDKKRTANSVKDAPSLQTDQEEKSRRRVGGVGQQRKRKKHFQEKLKE